MSPCLQNNGEGNEEDGPMIEGEKRTYDNDG